MVKILIITGILPITEIDKKKDENDIFLVTERELTKRYNNLSFEYLFVFPTANFLLSKISKKWNSYYNLGKKKQTISKGRMINLLALIMLPKRFWFRKYLYNLSFWMNEAYLDQIIKEHNPTVLHAQNIESDAYIARKISEKYKIPYIVSLRGGQHHLDALNIRNVKNARSLVAVSPIQRNIFLDLHNKISLIPHGIPEIFFNSKKNSFSSECLKFVVVTRLLPLKNIDKVIKALSRIKHNYIFDIYGDGPDRLRLEKLIKELHLTEKVKIKGKIDHEELPDILVRYNLFIMPSYPEALGRAYFEAMASGLPVIGSKLAGVDGIISHGEEGFLVNPKVDEIETILKSIFEHPTQLLPMKEAAMELAKSFSWDKIGEKYSLIYN